MRRFVKGVHVIAVASEFWSVVGNATRAIKPQFASPIAKPGGQRDDDTGGRVNAAKSSKGSRVSRSPESLSLIQHLADMAKGNHAALGKAYDAMGPVVFSLAVRMMRDRAAAEDVTQDVFVQIWRQAGNYDTQRGSPEAWIMMIARTRILDRLRSRSAGVVLKPVGDNLPDAADENDWPDDLAVSREDAVNVREALAELQPDQRQAIELAFFDGLTHVEISDKTGVPLGTIKTRIRLGLLKIREKLRGLMEDLESAQGDLR
jgi:RNA polymerase sigma-70 factor (ECF subfamily)